MGAAPVTPRDPALADISASQTSVAKKDDTAMGAASVTPAEPAFADISASQTSVAKKRRLRRCANSDDEADGPRTAPSQEHLTEHRPPVLRPRSDDEADVPSQEHLTAPGSPPRFDDNLEFQNDETTQDREAVPHPATPLTESPHESEGEEDGPPRPRTNMEQVYDHLASIPFPKGEACAKLGDPLSGWLDDLQAALQIPWLYVLMLCISLSSFQLHRTVGQYTSMLGLPPLPWIGIAGKPGEGKSIAIWFYKAVMMELQRRVNGTHTIIEDEDIQAPGEEEGGADEAKPEPKEPAEPKEPKGKKRKQPPSARYIADLGTFYGQLMQASQNDGRVAVTLHEGKPFLTKVLSEAPGYDPQALNKCYDRDEVSNTVMSVQSRFSMDFPWVLFFIALHLEDLKAVFGNDKDPCAVFARFDFFHQAGHIANLEEFGSMDADDAIEFIADVLQLIEVQFPKLTEEDRRKLNITNVQYSRRTDLWKIPLQGNAYFKRSFNEHTDKQKRAKMKGEDKNVSHHSKLKTKECRYALPIDAMVKGFDQKVHLEEYRQACIAKAKVDQDQDVVTALPNMPILALRQRVIDKEGEAMQKKMGLPFWERTPSDESTEVAHHVCQFLSESSETIQQYVRHGTPPNGTPDSALPAERKQKENQEDAKAVYHGDKLVELANQSNAKQVRFCVTALLTTPCVVTKLRDVTGFRGSKADQDVAVGICAELGAITKLSWKAPGKVGYPPVYVIKNHRASDIVVSMRMEDIMTTLAKSTLSAFEKKAKSTEHNDVMAFLEHHGKTPPPLSTGPIDAWYKKWHGFLSGTSNTAQLSAPDAELPQSLDGVRLTEEAALARDSKKQGETTKLATKAAEPAAADNPPTTPAREPHQKAAAQPKCTEGKLIELSDVVAGQRTSFIAWICTASQGASFVNSYLKTKLASKGFHDDGKDFEAIAAWFRSAGLALPGKRDSPVAKLTLARPPDDDIPKVVDMLATKFGLGASAKLKFDERLRKLGLVNNEFNFDTFLLLAEKLGEQGCMPEPNRDCSIGPQRVFDLFSREGE